MVQGLGGVGPANGMLYYRQQKQARSILLKLKRTDRDEGNLKGLLVRYSYTLWKSPVWGKVHKNLI